MELHRFRRIIAVSGVLGDRLPDQLLPQVAVFANDLGGGLAASGIRTPDQWFTKPLLYH